MKFFIKIISLFFLLISEHYSNAQKPPFWDEIQDFKKQDSIQFPPKHAILFVGSSSFRLWKNLNDYFPGYKIINRGFGASTLPDVIRYTSDIILPYQPGQVVIYCGENDLAVENSLKARVVFQRFQKLFAIIRKNIPEASIVFISIKPSPSREQLLPKFRKVNELVRTYLKKNKNTVYVDVYTEMINDEGKPRPELFLEDQLHMNEGGYLIWQKKLQPYLLKIK